MSISLLSSNIPNPAALIFLHLGVIHLANSVGNCLDLRLPIIPEGFAAVLSLIIEPPADFSKEFLSSILGASKTFCQTQSLPGYSPAYSIGTTCRY